MTKQDRINWLADALIEMEAPSVSNLYEDCGGKISRTTIRRLLPKAILKAQNTWQLGGTPKILVNVGGAS